MNRIFGETIDSKEQRKEDKRKKKNGEKLKNIQKCQENKESGATKSEEWGEI